MSTGLRESRHFARRQRRSRFYKRLFVLCVLGGLGVFAYWSGKTLSERSLEQARDDISQLETQTAELERRNDELLNAAAVDRQEIAALKRRYGKDVPKGERQKLLGLIDEQLGKGAKTDRLSFLIAAASLEEKCDGAPSTKRFLVRTPLYDGPAASVQFADGALTVTAAGEPAVDEAGRILGWYDPSKPVTLGLARLGQAAQKFGGTLPMHRKLVVNGSEYRLTVVAGDRTGFVNVTADRCRFP
ncbi:MAG: hypothetical protein GKS00_17830 [Alphaproteobacteria bacterium]|nr:hypothetical protein [Alphaproteobacteria bacterium]